ncbi:UNVERIFIED_CONTAM: hypothetical protein PYX00_005227 [Menopon gallinae]|uniref:LYR motif-containing protein 9 n=1 Tax=Menopon gallinae TaxID=328185 RepID=A0AAW2HQV6_9NEOP
MVQTCHVFRNSITTGRQLYKYLLRECKKLPPGASAYYRHSIKQSYKQHADETSEERIKEIIDRALEDTKWVLQKYAKQS